MTPQRSATSAQVTDALSLQAFTLCWSACLIFAKFSRSAIDTPLGTLTTCLAAASLLRPRSSVLLLLVAACRLVEYVDDLPYTTQHFYLNAGFSLAVVLGYVSAAIHGKKWVVSSSSLFRHFAPGARLIAFSCLFWAGLSKINTDFLNEKLSCASELYDYQRYYIPLLPESRFMRAAAPFIAIAGELGAALLLLVPRLRSFGFWLGLLFMLSVGLNPHNRVFVFAGPVMAVLLTFVPGQIWQRIADVGWIRVALPWLKHFWLRVAFFSFLAVLAAHGERGEVLRMTRKVTIVFAFYVGHPCLLDFWPGPGDAKI